MGQLPTPSGPRSHPAEPIDCPGAAAPSIAEHDHSHLGLSQITAGVIELHAIHMATSSFISNYHYAAVHFHKHVPPCQRPPAHPRHPHRSPSPCRHRFQYGLRLGSAAADNQIAARCDHPWCEFVTALALATTAHRVTSQSNPLHRDWYAHNVDAWLPGLCGTDADPSIGLASGPSLTAPLPPSMPARPQHRRPPSPTPLWPSTRPPFTTPARLSTPDAAPLTSTCFSSSGSQLCPPTSL